jgi:hypothetical protein
VVPPPVARPAEPPRATAQTTQTTPAVRPPAALPERTSVPQAERATPAPARDRVRPAPPPEVASPFDAVLGTILYSPDRKLAIVDGRIVGPGDEVRGARIVDITPTAVLLRDGQGRLRQLGLGSGAR